MRIDLLLLLLLAVGCLSACGKEGLPTPQEHRSMFAWGQTASELANHCLLISAELEGAYENVESFFLEVEPSLEDICLDCPFRPLEVVRVMPTSNLDGLFSFQYCPSDPAEAYRWRLVARNIHRGLPHTVSPVQLVQNPS